MCLYGGCSSILLQPHINQMGNQRIRTYPSIFSFGTWTYLICILKVERNGRRMGFWKLCLLELQPILSTFVWHIKLKVGHMREFVCSQYDGNLVNMLSAYQESI